MYLKHYLFIILISICFIGFAQNQSGHGFNGQMPEAKLSGIVLDAESGNPLEYASVALIRVRDSSIAAGSITDVGGRFEIKTTPGRFYVRVDFISYESKVINDIMLESSSLIQDLGEISISPNIMSLDEVEITAERSRFEMSLDKKIFNVGQDLTTIGGTASDVLDNIPSVTVDIDGNVSLRGSTNVRMLINGKPSGLTGISSTEALQQFPANLIERVEIITNPSARYDAEGLVGIINIILKEDKRKGLNGTIDGGLSNPLGGNGSVNINYRKNKFNLFGMYGIRYRNNEGRGVSYRETYGAGGFILQEDQSYDRSGLSNTIRFGTDFFINENNTLTGAFLYRFGDQDMDVLINYIESDFSNNITGFRVREGVETEKEPNFDYSLSYKKTFEKPERSLTADIQFSQNYEEEISDITETSFASDMTPLPAEDLYQRSLSNEEVTSFFGQVDYQQPIGDNGNFETGYRNTIRNIDNNFIVEELDSLGNWQTLPGQINNVLYEENIMAGYALYGTSLNKFSIQAGLRAEMTIINIEAAESTLSENKDYLNFFPSAHVTYEFVKDKSMQVSYGRRIRRPRFRQMNPFFSYFNSQNIRVGNPNLNPEFTHSVELSYMQNNDKSSLMTSIYYRYTEGVIQWIRTLQDSITITRPENLSTRNSYGLEISGSYDPVKWLRLDGSLNFFRNIVDGGNLNESFKSDDFSWTGRFNSMFKLNVFDAQLSFNYRAPIESAQGKNKSMYHADLAFSRDIFKKKGTLSLRARDLFNTRKRRSITIDDDFYMDSEFQWRPRTITLGLTYRINQKKKRNQRNREDESFDGGEEF